MDSIRNSKQHSKQQTIFKLTNSIENSKQYSKQKTLTAITNNNKNNTAFKIAKINRNRKPY